jgi:hypothetical protein
VTAVRPEPPHPRSPGEITGGWLTAALRASGAISDATFITAASVEAISDLGGVNGETCRVRLEYEPPALNATDRGPQTLVAKFPADRAGARGVAAFQRWYQREVSFYTTLAATSPIRTPRCHAAAIDPSGEYVLLLEDLHAWRQGDQLAGCTVDDARVAIEAAARLHARWWDAAPPASDVLPDTTIGRDRATRVQGALERVAARATEHHGLPKSMTVELPRLVAGYIQLLDRMATPPVTVVHGDFRLDNLFFAAATTDDAVEVAAIDWRCRGTYDIGYFIGLDLAPALRRTHEHDLLAGYVAGLHAHGVTGYEATDAWEDYRHALLLAFAVFLIGASGEQLNERMARVHEVGLTRLATAIEETGAFAVLD